jgi:ribonuclease HI
VKGHADNPNNNRCDELATEAADSADLEIDEGYVKG